MAELCSLVKQNIANTFKGFSLLGMLELSAVFIVMHSVQLKEVANILW